MNRDSVKEADQLFAKITSINPNGRAYLYMHNSSEKKWYFPQNNITVGKISSGMYHPMSMKGKLVKLLLIYFRKTLLLTGVVNSIKLNVCKELEKYISDIFEIRKDDIQITFFLGTPCEYQKIIIQVSQQNRVLGYIKISDNERVVNVFRKEFYFLEWLKQRHVNSVPQALNISSLLSDEIYLYAQSTLRDSEARESKELTRQAVSFLAEFCSKTMQSMNFQKTEYYEKLRWLSDNSVYISHYYDITEKAIKRVVNYYDRVSKFCACHGDFTPWNSFVTKENKLFAYDYEYALYSCPRGIDAFHWVISAQIFQRNTSAEKIYKKLQKERIKIEALVDDFGTACLAYLIIQLVNVCYRDKGNFSHETLQNISIWVAMMKIFMDEDH